MANAIRRAAPMISIAFVRLYDGFREEK